jgi:pimeloyl-ACP methyl ester carboxylesterase
MAELSVAAAISPGTQAHGAASSAPASSSMPPHTFPLLMGLGLATGMELYAFDSVNPVLPDLAGTLSVSGGDTLATPETLKAGADYALSRRHRREKCDAGLSGSPPSIVLVHGGFVDGSGWEGVYKILKKDGYDVSIVQNPTTSLADDVAATRLVIDQAKGPVVLVGHSYGGVVITEAGMNPKVAGLVYITAFAPDKGESVETLIQNPPPGTPVPPIMPPVNGYLFLDKAKFRDSFAADVAEAEAAFMADSQVPWGVGALAGAVTEPSWKAKPSWYLVATDDKMIPPPAQRQMASRAGATATEAAMPSTSRSRRR